MKSKRLKQSILLLSILLAAINLILPAMQMLAVRIADAPTFELCSGTGIKLLPGSKNSQDSSSHPSLQHCVFCPQSIFSAHSDWPQTKFGTSLSIRFVPHPPADEVEQKPAFIFQNIRAPPSA